MSRHLAIHLPAFRLERCGFTPDEVAVLIHHERNAMRLVSLTPAAHGAGLHAGMTVSEARSVVPELQVELLDPLGEAHDRGELCRAFARLSDHVNPLGEQDLVLDVTKTATSHGGEGATFERAVVLARELGHHVFAALTDDPIAARALARSGRQGIVSPGGMAAALAPLPVHAMGATPELLHALGVLGIRTLGPFAQLDPASVSGRFGPDGVRLHRIARGICSVVDRSSLSWTTDDLPVVSAALAGATTTLQLHFVLPGLLAGLVQALADRDLAAVQLRCVLLLEAGSPTSFGVRVGRPTRDVTTLEHLVRTRLATVRIEAPVEEWRIEVHEAVPALGWQPGLTDRVEATEPLPDLLARLIDALGEAAVFAAEPVDTWRPERSWQPIPLPLQPIPRLGPPPPDDVVALQERWENNLSWARPTQLLERAQPIAVELSRSGVPVQLTLDDRIHGVRRAQGPELLSGDWWRPHDAWDRQYWVVDLPQGTCWIYSSEARWYLHGWF